MFEATFPPSDTAVSQARSLVRRHLFEAGHGQRVRDVVELLTSELITNAVHYGGGPVRLGMSLVPSEVAERVRVEVADAAATRLPILREDNPNAENGRGIALVASLSTTWGVEPRDSEKIVWFEVDVIEPDLVDVDALDDGAADVREVGPIPTPRTRLRR